MDDKALEHWQREAYKNQTKYEALETLLDDARLELKQCNELKEMYQARVMELTKAWAEFTSAWNLWLEPPVDGETEQKLSENLAAGLAMLDDAMGTTEPLRIHTTGKRLT